MEILKTGDLAKRAGMNVETLRYYERKGLIEEPPRRMSGYREYPSDTVQQVRFIKRAQELGFSLREIKDLLSLRVEPGTTCSQVRQRGKKKIAEIQQKIADLQAIETALGKLVASCSGRGPATRCPILEHLNSSKS